MFFDISRRFVFYTVCDLSGSLGHHNHNYPSFVHIVGARGRIQLDQVELSLPVAYLGLFSPLLASQMGVSAHNGPQNYSTTLVPISAFNIRVEQLLL